MLVTDKWEEHDEGRSHSQQVLIKKAFQLENVFTDLSFLDNKVILLSGRISTSKK